MSRRSAQPVNMNLKQAERPKDSTTDAEMTAKLTAEIAAKFSSAAAKRSTSATRPTNDANSGRVSRRHLSAGSAAAAADTDTSSDEEETNSGEVVVPSGSAPPREKKDRKARELNKLSINANFDVPTQDANSGRGTRRRRTVGTSDDAATSSNTDAAAAADASSDEEETNNTEIDVPSGSARPKEKKDRKARELRKLNIDAEFEIPVQDASSSTVTRRRRTVGTSDDAATSSSDAAAAAVSATADTPSDEEPEETDITSANEPSGSVPPKGKRTARELKKLSINAEFDVPVLELNSGRFTRNRLPTAAAAAAADFTSEDPEDEVEDTAGPSNAVSPPVIPARKRVPRERTNLAIDMVPTLYAVSDEELSTDGIATRNRKRPAAAAADAATPDEPPAKKPLMLRNLCINMVEAVFTVEESSDGKRSRRSLRKSGEKKESSEPLSEDGKEEGNEEVKQRKKLQWLTRETNDTPWDKTEKSLNRMRKAIAKETIFGDYYEKFKEEAEEIMMKNGIKKGLAHDPSQSRKLFWFNEICQTRRADPSHASLECTKLLSRKTESDVESLLRFIAIGALCERCKNPFGLSPESLDKAAPTCTCPKPAPSVFKLTPRLPADLPDGITQHKMLREDWNSMCNIEEVKAREGLKTQLILEMGYKKFFKKYPFCNVPLSARTDEFGIAVYLKQLELHKLKRENNQPPTFIFAWTGKSEGEAYLPKEWILDGVTELSEAAEEKVKGKNGGMTYLKCTCTDNCASGTCCTDCNKIRVKWHINRNGILMQKNGLGPCGTDDDSIRQPHETDWVQAAVCGEECGCGLDCPSRFADRGSQKMKIIFMTHFKGWSVRTVEPMVRGEYVLSFSGVLSTQDEMKANNENLEMVFDITGKKGTKAEDMLTIATDKKSNEFRCFNHSCAPNSLILTTYSKKWGELVHGVALFARRNLKAYEEITFDYYLPGQRFRFDCKCGSYACRGIKGADV